MNIEIVTIGDELLLGFTIDTNAAYLARELAAFGVSVVRRTTCGDSAESIAEAVGSAIERTGAVITTGGLGPTADDVTKASIAKLFGRGMYLDETIAEGLRELWRSRKRSGEIPQSNFVQAMIPDGARILHNARGTAPGIFLEDERGRWVAMLPGVPREMRGMFDDVLKPIIRERIVNSTARAAVQTDAQGNAQTDDELHVIASRTLRTTGVAESLLAESLGALGHGFDGLSVAFLPNVDGVDLRLTVRGVNAREGADRLAYGVHKIRDLLGRTLGDVIYGEGTDTLAASVLNACRTADVRLAVAESCTGGMMSERVTAIAGSSDVFVGGIVAYDNSVKREMLDISEDDLRAYGAVSEVVVRQMARGARNKLGAQIGVGITGIAGPSGGSQEKPTGTVWIAVDAAVPVAGSNVPHLVEESRLFHFWGDRDEVRQRAAQAGLNMVRRLLADLLAGVAPRPERIG